MLNLDDGFAMFSNRFSEILERSQGKPFVFDHGGMRTLHFDGRYIQSAMQLAAPDELLLSYTRAMMAFLLVKPSPAHILMIGLGGGSLAKYCYRHLPAARITVVEIDPGVIALRNDFALPADNERFEVIHADACEYLKSLDQTVDVILHDGFVADGLAPELSTEWFYRRCVEVLAADGVLVSNLFATADDLVPTMTRLRSVFGGKLWWGDPSGCVNRIVLSTKAVGQMEHRSALEKLALRIDLCYGLGLSEFVERLQTAHDKSDNQFEAIAKYAMHANLMDF